jgi:hypothetical protein
VRDGGDHDLITIVFLEEIVHLLNIKVGGRYSSRNGTTIALANEVKHETMLGSIEFTVFEKLPHAIFQVSPLSVHISGTYIIALLQRTYFGN